MNNVAAPCAQRVGDVERRGRRVDVHRDRLRAALERLEGVGERRCAAEEPAPVASARYSRWRETASWRSIAASGAKMIVASVPMKPSGLSSSSAAEEQPELEHVRDRRDRARDHGGDRPDEDVAVLDVGELVGEHAAHLVLGHRAEQALGHGDRRVLGVTARRERVRLVGRDQVQPRHR